MSSFGQRGPAPPAPCAPDSCRSWHCGPLKPLTLEAVSRLGCEGRRAERSSPGTWRPLATVAGAPGSCWRGPGATVRHVPFPSFPDTRRRPRIRLCRTAGRLPSRLGPGLRPSGWPVISPACSPVPPGGLPDQDASLPAPLPCPAPPECRSPRSRMHVLRGTTYTSVWVCRLRAPPRRPLRAAPQPSPPVRSGGRPLFPPQWPCKSGAPFVAAAHRRPGGHHHPPPLLGKWPEPSRVFSGWRRLPSAGSGVEVAQCGAPKGPGPHPRVPQGSSLHPPPLRGLHSSRRPARRGGSPHASRRREARRPRVWLCGWRALSSLSSGEGAGAGRAVGVRSARGAETLAARLRDPASLPRDVPAVRCSPRARRLRRAGRTLGPLCRRCPAGGRPPASSSGGRTRAHAPRGLPVAASHLVLFSYFVAVV